MVVPSDSNRSGSSGEQSIRWICFLLQHNKSVICLIHAAKLNFLDGEKTKNKKKNKEIANFKRAKVARVRHR